MKLENENFMTLPTNYRIIGTLSNVHLSLEKLNKICLKHHIIISVDIISRNNHAYLRIVFKSCKKNVLVAIHSSLLSIAELNTNKKKQTITAYIEFGSERGIISMTNDNYNLWLDSLLSELKLMRKSLKHDLKYI